MNTKNLIKKLRKELRKDILERYDTPEYWDFELIDELLQNYGIEDEEKKEKIIEKLTKES